MRGIVLATAAVACLPACYVENSSKCTRTEVQAEPADKVDLRAVGRSSVVSAELMAGDTPLSGKRLVFEIRDGGSTLYEGEARTDRSGVARYDLKRVDQAALLALARADDFQATFDGDGTYCSSGDEAPFKLLNT